jgi:hypothetical protein
MERIELTQTEQQLLSALSEEMRPYMHPGRHMRPEDFPTDVGWRTRSAWQQIAADHGLDVRRCNFQVDPATGNAWIMYRPEPLQPQP